MDGGGAQPTLAFLRRRSSAEPSGSAPGGSEASCSAPGSTVPGLAAITGEEKGEAWSEAGREPSLWKRRSSAVPFRSAPGAAGWSIGDGGGACVPGTAALGSARTRCGGGCCSCGGGAACGGGGRAGEAVGALAQAVEAVLCETELGHVERVRGRERRGARRRLGMGLHGGDRLHLRQAVRAEVGVAAAHAETEGGGSHL